jgi:hypothetical protein
MDFTEQFNDFWSLDNTLSIYLMFVFMVFGNMKIYYQNKTTKKGEF